MVQLNRMTENPEEIPSVDECLRKYDADVLVSTGGIDVEVRAGWTGNRERVEIAHNGVRRDDDVKATWARPVSNGVTSRL